MKKWILFVISNLFFSGCFFGSYITSLNNFKTGIIGPIDTLSVVEGQPAKISFVWNGTNDSTGSFNYEVVPVTAVAAENYIPIQGTIQGFEQGKTYGIEIETLDFGISTGTEKEFSVIVKSAQGDVLYSRQVKILGNPQNGLVHEFEPMSAPELNFIDMGAYFLYAAKSAGSGIELWRSDGTLNGTSLVKDICPGSCSSSASGFVKLAGVAYFIAVETDGGVGKIYRSDGTDTGTYKIFEVSQISTAADPNQEYLISLYACEMDGTGCASQRKILFVSSTRLFFLTFNSSAAPFEMQYFFVPRYTR